MHVNLNFILRQNVNRTRLTSYIRLCLLKDANWASEPAPILLEGLATLTNTDSNFYLYGHGPLKDSNVWRYRSDLQRPTRSDEISK